MSTDTTAPAATPAPNEGQPSTIVRIDKETARRDFDKPYAYATWVPSQGHLYPEGKFPGGSVVMAPMSVGEEKILQQAGKDKMELVDTLIQRCLLKCPVPYEDLLIPDMFYLLLVIRNITYGADYQFRVECDGCGTEYMKRVTLPSGLEMKCLDETDEGEPWEVVLPDREDRVGFRMLRVKDEAEIRRYARKAYGQSHQVGDPSYVYRLSKHIVTINGQPADPLKRLNYVETMYGRDSLTLRNAIESKDFGVKLMLNLDCPHCGKSDRTKMPFDKEFFRPSNLTPGPK